MRKVQYTTQEERQTLFNEAQDNGETLFEEANITEGNFLTFGLPSEKPEQTKTEFEILQEENEQLRQQITQEMAAQNQAFSDFLDFYFTNNNPV